MPLVYSDRKVQALLTRCSGGCPKGGSDRQGASSGGSRAVLRCIYLALWHPRVGWHPARGPGGVAPTGHNQGDRRMISMISLTKKAPLTGWGAPSACYRGRGGVLDGA